VNPVPDPLVLRKSSNARNRTRDLSAARNSDYSNENITHIQFNSEYFIFIQKINKNILLIAVLYVHEEWGRCKAVSVLNYLSTTPRRHEGVGVEIHFFFFTLALVRGVWPASCPSRFTLVTAGWEAG
jgi:hypothetical protein